MFKLDCLPPRWVLTYPTLSSHDKILSIITDFDEPLSNIIRDGHFDWIHSDVTIDHFPSTTTGRWQTEIALVSLGRLVGDCELRQEMQERSLYPAELRDLLAIATMHPQEQEQSPILATGSVWNCEKKMSYVPVVETFPDDKKRILNLRLSGEGFDYTGICRFPIVLWRRRIGRPSNQSGQG